MKFSPSSIADFLSCRHLTALNRAARAGEIKKPYFADPGLELLRKLGLAQEVRYRKELTDQMGLTVVGVPDGLEPNDAAARTVEAMNAGADAIYQASFLTSELCGAQIDPNDKLKHEIDHDKLKHIGHPGWYGRADFLVRVAKPSQLGDWSYEVVETKLARSTKARAIIQLCFYSDMVTEIQGVMPDYMHVVLGGNAQPEKFFVQRYLAYFRKVKSEFEAAVVANANTYPEPVEHCRICDWETVCDQRWRADDHLSLVANITRNQRKVLVERDINNVAQLATLALPVTPKLEGIAPAPLLRIREQARLQVEGRTQKKPVHELIQPFESGKGLAALPTPSPGDLFLDFEGDPFAFELGIEYLIGMVTEGNDGAPQYESIWASDPKAEKQAFIEFIERVKERRRHYPSMHIYHYATYEPTAIKHLAGRHGVCTGEVDELLRAEVFVDLYRVVRQGVRASVESYSIKKMEPFYGFRRTVPLRDATSSLQAIEAVFAIGDDPAAAQEILKTIEDYNRDDCVSTLRLRTWLESLRSELEVSIGTSIPRPELKSGAPNEELEAKLSEIGILKERLVGGFPEDESEWSEEQRACWLLAQLLEWHRREDKSMWWEYYRMCDLSDEELIQDKNALGGLVYDAVVEEKNRSFVHRYRFPVQDHSIDRARNVHDPRTRKPAGTRVGLDEVNRTVDLKREKSSQVPHPTSLIPHNHVPSDEQVGSLMRIATWVIKNGFEQGFTGSGGALGAAKKRSDMGRLPPFPTCTGEEADLQSGPTRTEEGAGPNAKFQAATDLLLKRAPRLSGVSVERLTDELSLLDAAREMGLRLNSSALPIQGPPGSGKTFTGAHMIIELVKAGKRVGVTAGSHKVISNLLLTLCKEAVKQNIKLTIAQKPDRQKRDGCKHDFVVEVPENEDVLNKLQSGEASIAAGTAWLWSREEMAGVVDVLFVDEAGQMSLANVLAVSPAAKSVVLLGDPQQLDQPQKGVHPPGAEVSALAHLLKGKATIEPGQGLFLNESWRLHPDVCAFTSETFYEGRLVSRPENRMQRLNAGRPEDNHGDTENTEEAQRRFLDGTGLRFVPVEHEGNQSESVEEAEKVAELVVSLLKEGSTWTDKDGIEKRITLDDILIVAPYNAQVSLLAQRLPEGARVGTVDKFQGQEAPVVFYSMATSTPEDAPRGMEFLYSLNRLNVASSRAQCVTVLVASPALFDVQCKTPRQMELANAFCRYLEMATVV